MSTSGSDAENDEQMKRIMEARDSTLLSNSLYEEKGKENAPHMKKQPLSSIKSQRYLLEEQELDDIDLPETTKQYVAKKLSDIIAQQVQFDNCYCNTKIHNPMNRVKLLAGFDCYVKPYEEFEFENKGPLTKPVFKRREVDAPIPMTETERIKSCAISYQNLFTKLDFDHRKRKRKERHFEYKRLKNGTLRLQEPKKEF